MKTSAIFGTESQFSILSSKSRSNSSLNVSSWGRFLKITENSCKGIISCEPFFILFSMKVLNSTPIRLSTSTKVFSEVITSLALSYSFRCCLCALDSCDS